MCRSTYHFDPDNMPVSCSTVRNAKQPPSRVDKVDDDDIHDANADNFEHCIESQRNDPRPFLDDYSSEINKNQQFIDQSVGTVDIQNIDMSREVSTYVCIDSLTYYITQ